MSYQKNNPFSEALKNCRKKRRMTQTELAEKAGISAMSISRYENGESIPDMGILASICVELQEDSLLDAWMYSAGKIKGEDSDPRRRMNTFLKAKDLMYQKYWDELVSRGTWTLRKRLVSVAQYLQNMNGQGFKKTMDIIEALSMVPEYKDESGWAFTSKEGIEDEGEDQGE